jgi:hypothetical protein
MKKMKFNGKRLNLAILNLFKKENLIQWLYIMISI